MNFEHEAHPARETFIHMVNGREIIIRSLDSLENWEKIAKAIKKFQSCTILVTNLPGQENHRKLSLSSWNGNRRKSEPPQPYALSTRKLTFIKSFRRNARLSLFYSVCEKPYTVCYGTWTWPRWHEYILKHTHKCKILFIIMSKKQDIPMSHSSWPF